MVEEKRNLGPHNIIMEDRRRLTVTGVTDVDSFDEQTVVVYCETGELAIRGDGLSYADNHPARGGFFGKLFR